MFDLSFENGIFLVSLKIEKVTLVYKSGDNSRLSSYRPTSVLPCFSKLPERLYNYLQESKILLFIF